MKNPDPARRPGAFALHCQQVSAQPNSALTHRSGPLAEDADAGIKLTRAALDAITLKQRSFLCSIVAGDISIGQSAETARTVRPARRFHAEF
jgi:hypothetical protein